VLPRRSRTWASYATAAGITIGIDDLHVPPEKPEIISRADRQVQQIAQDYADGVITAGERYNRIIDTWTNATNMVSETLFDELGRDREGFNPIFMMAFSGSRGSKEQIRQLAGMRGLMAKPQKKITGGIGEIIEMPITANFREGLTVLQYFISTHGARKGLADTALKTADSGYLTRRLVDVAQDVIVNLPIVAASGLKSARSGGRGTIEPPEIALAGWRRGRDRSQHSEIIVHAGEETARPPRAIEERTDRERSRSVGLGQRARHLREVLRTQPGDLAHGRTRQPRVIAAQSIEAWHSSPPDVPHRRRRGASSSSRIKVKTPGTIRFRISKSSSGKRQLVVVGQKRQIEIIGRTAAATACRLRRRRDFRRAPASARHRVGRTTRRF
jgi:hypothetical protein